MTTTKAVNVATTARTKLERAVARWLNRTAREYESGVEGVARDLFTGGCASGFVTHLIYTRDSERFALRHMVDILDLMQEDTGETGERPQPRDGADVDLNWLAWYGFESAARRVLDQAGVEY